MKRLYAAASVAARRRRRQSPPRGAYRYVRTRWRLLIGFIDWIGWKLIGRRRGESVAPPDPSTVRRLLLVQLDHLGDAVITAQMLPALRRRFPHASLEVLCGAWTQGVFAACPEVNRIHASRWNRFNRRFRLGWLLATVGWGLALRRRKYDLAVDVRGELPLAFLIWLTGAPVRAGWDAGGGGFLLTHRVPWAPGRPEVESRQALLAGLGVPPDETRQRPWLHAGRTAEGSIAARLKDPAIQERLGPLIVLHVGAGTPAKRWPASHFQELLGRVLLEFDANIILVGVAGERPLAVRVLGPAPWPGVYDWTGALQIMETAALLAQADLFIGADSGVAHLAAAVDARGVVLFSGTNDSRQWRPASDRIRVLRQPVGCAPCHRTACAWSDHPCMAQLSPAVVMEAVSAALAAAGFTSALDALPMAESATTRIPARQLR